MFTYSVSPRWQVSADTMVYARVATGYRPGGPNPRALDLPPTVVADTLTNYELGLKSQFLGGRALVNVAAFRIDWQDIQQAVVVGGIGSVDNTGNAVSKGFEIETAYSAHRSSAHRRQRGVHRCAADIARRGHRRGPARQHATLECIGTCSITNSRSRIAGRRIISGGWRYVGEQGTAIAAQTGADIPMSCLLYGSLDLAAELTRGSWTIRALRPQRYRPARLHRRRPGVDADNVPYGIDANVLQPRTVGIGVDVGF